MIEFDSNAENSVGVCCLLIADAALQLCLRNTIHNPLDSDDNSDKSTEIFGLQEAAVFAGTAIAHTIWPQKGLEM